MSVGDSALQLRFWVHNMRMLAPCHRRPHVPGSAVRLNVNLAVLEIRGVEVPGIIAVWLVPPRSRKDTERHAINPTVGIVGEGLSLPAVVSDVVEVPVCHWGTRAADAASKVPPRVDAFLVPLLLALRTLCGRWEGEDRYGQRGRERSQPFRKSKPTKKKRQVT